MNISLSPIGVILVVLANFAVSLVFSLIWRRLPQGRGKRLSIHAAVSLAVTAALTWDAFIVGYNKEKYCKQAGVFVEEPVRVAGYYDDTYSWDGDASKRHLVEFTDFQYIEYRNWRDKKYYRLQRDGVQATQVVIDQPISRYHLKNTDVGTKIAYLVRMSRAVVLDTQTNKVVGEAKSYYLMPPWIDRLWLRFFDNSETQCLHKTRLPETVLLPIE